MAIKGTKPLRIENQPNLSGELKEHGELTHSA